MPQIWTLLRINPLRQTRYLSHLTEFHPAIETYVPHYLKLCRPHGMRRPIPISKPCYPGYIFARPDTESGEHLALISLPIRAYFIRFGKVIESIPDRVILELKRLESLKQLEPTQEPGWKQGQSVRVSTPTLEIRAIVVRLITQDKLLVDTPFCQMVVPLKSVIGL